MAIKCDRYGFFNGIYGLEQKNWADYWRYIIPDGVIAGEKNEMEVVASTTYVSGVSIKPGSAMVDNHRVWINAQKELQLPAAGSQNRIDLIVLRAVYGNSGESKVELDVITGAAAASPSQPQLTKVTGSKYEIPLARVYRPAGNNNVAGQITDMRYVFHLPSDDDTVSAFSGNSVVCQNDREHRNNSALTSLTVYLPANPCKTFITGVCFSTASSFSGITFRKGTPSSSTTINQKTMGDTLNLVNRRYNMVIWWDGVQYAVAVKSING